MNVPIYLGVWAFRAFTTAAPLLTALELQLQQHQFDPWALGAAAIASVLVAGAHLARVQAPGAAVPPTTGGTP